MTDTVWRMVPVNPTEDVSHIVGWFKAAVSDDARWLAKTGEHDRPKRLPTVGSLDVHNTPPSVVS